MADIQKYQTTINNLSSKRVSTFTTADFKQLDTAKTKFKNLKNQIADTKVELSDVSVGGLAKGIVARSLGYTAIFATIAGVTQAMRAGITYTLEYESGVKRLETILDTSSAKAEKLEGSLAKLGRTYGEQLGDINKVALELARAGLALDDVAKASEVVIKLALLTGDSIEQSASSIISFVQVFGKDQFGNVISTVDELGAKLAYLANKSRLGTQDINTFANYALASAKATGLTIDAVNGLASAFSNASFNASTIGTQIRKFTIALSSDSGAVKKFFESIGVNQAILAKKIAQGGDESNKALLEFLENIKSYNTESYNESLSGVEVLTKNVLQALQNNANEIQTNLRESLQVTSAEIDKAKNITEDYRKTWSKFGENAKSIAQSVFDPFIDKATDLARALNNSIDAVSFFGVSLSKDVQLSTITNAVDTAEMSLNRFRKGLGSTEELIKFQDRVKLITNTLYVLKNQASEDRDYKSITKLNKLLKEINDTNRQLSKEMPSILSNTETANIEAKIKNYEKLIEAQEKLLASGKIEKDSKQWIVKNNLIKTYTKNIEALSGTLDTKLDKAFKSTMKYFSSADLDTFNKGLTRLNKSIGITDPNQLSDVVTKMFSNLKKEIPAHITKIQSDLQSSGVTIDLGSIVTFGDISDEALSLQDKIYDLQQSKDGKTVEESKSIDLQILAYQKAHEQLTRILDAQTKLLSTKEKIKTQQDAINSANQKDLNRQDEKTKQLIKQQVAQAKLKVSSKEASTLLLAEINARGEAYSKLVTQKAQQDAITKLLKS